MTRHAHVHPTSPLLRIAAMALVAACAAAAARAQDWPTYMHDNARSGVTTPSPVLPLKPAWTFNSTYPPQPAWSGSAKEDKYSNPGPLASRQMFDRAFFTVAAAGRVYFGSSADDKVYCLDAATGREIWAFYTEGPVRLAPTIAGGRILFGSDDGCVYCLDAATGDLHWKKRLGPRDHRVPGNGRVISIWPVRGSVAVIGGVAYTCAGMFPNDGVYVTALKVADGSIVWQTVMNDLPAQGYTLASPTRLYVPTGRNNPTVFERDTGKRLYTVQGQGGTYALLTQEQNLIFGPGKTGTLGVIETDAADQFAHFAGNHMIVTGDMSYLHDDKSLSALDRGKYLALYRRRTAHQRRQAELAKAYKAATQKGDKPQIERLRADLIEASNAIDETSRQMDGCVTWHVECAEPYALILAGDTLLAGGNGRVAAYHAADGKANWSADVAGRAYGLTFAGGRLFVSTDKGAVYCFTPEDADAN